MFISVILSAAPPRLFQTETREREVEGPRGFFFYSYCISLLRRDKCQGTASAVPQAIQNDWALDPEGFLSAPEAALTVIAAMLRLLPLALRLRTSGHAGMAEILLGVLAQHLAFMTTNRAFHNNFGSGSRRSVHVGWSHPFKLRALRPYCNTNRHDRHI
jgi:hypothetical protein